MYGIVKNGQQSCPKYVRNYNLPSFFLRVTVFWLFLFPGKDGSTVIFDGHSDLLFALSRCQKAKALEVFRKTYYDAFQQGAVEGGIFVLWGDPDCQQSIEIGRAHV